MRATLIDTSTDDFQKAKNAAITLTNQHINGITQIMNSKSLQDAEESIRNFNEYSGKCWLLSSIILFTLIYDQSLYQQSGLTWKEYLHDSRARLGLDSRDITEMLSSARFFLAHHEKLVNAGWTPERAARKMARAELALDKSGSLDDTIEHLTHDTWMQFNAWYQSFDKKHKLPQNVVIKRDDIMLTEDKILVKGVEPVIINELLPPDERESITAYIRQLYELIKEGYEPIITHN